MNSCQQLTFLKSIHFVYASFIDVQQICLSSATCITSELGVGRTFCYMVFTSQSHNAVTKSALYLSNRTCYDKTVCTVLFSSRWWVCWCKLFSVLSTLQINGKILTKRQVYNKGIFIDLGNFSRDMRYWYHWNVQLILSEMM